MSSTGAQSGDNNNGPFLQQQQIVTGWQVIAVPVHEGVTVQQVADALGEGYTPLPIGIVPVATGAAGVAQVDKPPIVPCLLFARPVRHSVPVAEAIM